MEVVVLLHDGGLLSTAGVFSVTCKGLWHWFTKWWYWSRYSQGTVVSKNSAPLLLPSYLVLIAVCGKVLELSVVGTTQVWWLWGLWCSSLLLLWEHSPRSRISRPRTCGPVYSAIDRAFPPRLFQLEGPLVSEQKQNEARSGKILLKASLVGTGQKFRLFSPFFSQLSCLPGSSSQLESSKVSLWVSLGYAPQRQGCSRPP
jgi:hypothetical protein